MLTKETLIAHCLKLPGAYEDRPFKGNTVVLRHKGNKKGFLFLIHAHGRLHVNVKCEPLRAELLRQTYSGVIPAYHMNKEHWNSVLLGEDVPEGEVLGMVALSYDLTKPRQRKAPRP